jgi:hypothetical protein
MDNEKLPSLAKDNFFPKIENQFYLLLLASTLKDGTET